MHVINTRWISLKNLKVDMDIEIGMEDNSDKKKQIDTHTHAPLEDCPHPKKQKIMM